MIKIKYKSDSKNEIVYLGCKPPLKYIKTVLFKYGKSERNVLNES